MAETCEACGGYGKRWGYDVDGEWRFSVCPDCAAKQTDGEGVSE